MGRKRTALADETGIGLKHGPIYPLNETGVTRSHLEPIKDFITRGIADADEAVTLSPQACDVKGARPFDGQQCVIARALSRTLQPEAVAVGRSLAYAVFNGLAVRFFLPADSRRVVEEFDRSGRVKRADIELRAVTKSWRIGYQRKNRGGKTRPADGRVTRPSRARKYGVRAVGGGMTTAE